MERSHFERLVRRALDTIPDELYAYLDNVDIVVEDWPTPSQLAVNEIEDGEYLLGLYEGVPLTERHEYGNVLPDKITIFQKSIEAVCGSPDEVIEQVRETVVHEVAHHFGIDDARLEELGAG
ncbi:MAG: metallopeptidase family protein [SAR202 cluster bacterium]|nr:metallopeptidase family protein [SAR202 cluster bacterium]